MNAYCPLPVDGCLLQPSATRVLLLTGQSSDKSSALSPVQTAFLEAIAPPDAVITRTGFPYHEALAQQPYDDAPLLTASLLNARQVQRSLTSPAFRAAVAARLTRAIEATQTRLILITGSCGLELANSAWPLLPPRKNRIDIVALGPACFRRLVLPAMVIQGGRDHWSRLLYRGPVHQSADCGHLNYWQSAEVQALVRSAIHS